MTFILLGKHCSVYAYDLLVFITDKDGFPKKLIVRVLSLALIMQGRYVLTNAQTAEGPTIRKQRKNKKSRCDKTSTTLKRHKLATTSFAFCTKQYHMCTTLQQYIFNSKSPVCFDFVKFNKLSSTGRSTIRISHHHTKRAWVVILKAAPDVRFK